MNLSMIDIKSWVNKDYIIQFSIKSRKGKIQNRQIKIVNTTSTIVFSLAVWLVSFFV